MYTNAADALSVTIANREKAQESVKPLVDGLLDGVKAQCLRGLRGYTSGLYHLEEHFANEVLATLGNLGYVVQVFREEGTLGYNSNPDATKFTITW